MPPLDETADLEDNLIDVARSLFAPGTALGVLQRAVDLAVATIEGCDAAGVVSERAGKAVTLASTAQVVVDLDHLQITSDEGPCIDALRGDRSTHALDLADDDRWPTFGPAAARAGIRSTLAFHLADEPASALNLYAHLPAAFGAHDRAQGVIFAGLAGLALDVAEERADEEQRFTNLHEALVTRELIGQAQGILIERERITAEQAFDVLRRASQHLNIKVREVARTLIETGETPETGKAARPDT